MMVFSQSLWWTGYKREEVPPSDVCAVVAVAMFVIALSYDWYLAAVCQFYPVVDMNRIILPSFLLLFSMPTFLLPKAYTC